MSKSNLTEDIPSSEISSLFSGGISYLKTCYLFFTNPEELGRCIDQRDWDGISKPLTLGASSTAVAVIVFWLLGIEANLGKYPLLLWTFVKDWPFLFVILGFILVLQIVASRSLSIRTYFSCLLCLVYVIGFFILPFSLVVILMHFSDSLIKITDSAIPLALIFIAPLFGYTVILGMPKLLSGTLRCDSDLVFWTFIIYGGVAVKIADYFFPLWQFR